MRPSLPTPPYHPPPPPLCRQHFEQDDPELYRTKITLIESCEAAELAELDLIFTDEEFDGRGQLTQVGDGTEIGRTE